MRTNVSSLLYHQILPDGASLHTQFSVHASVFRKQLKYLSEKGFYTPALSAFVNGELADSEPGRKPILITFDDGYLDNLNVALPILKEFNFSATVFVVTDENRRTMWWDETVAQFKYKLMDPGHVLSLHEAGIEIGSHTVTHRSLITLSDSELAYELSHSRYTLEKILNKKVEWFSYPYGELNGRVREAVIAAGYSCAFATNSGPLNSYADLFRIRRMSVKNSTGRFGLFLKTTDIEKALRWGKSLILG